MSDELTLGIVKLFLDSIRSKSLAQRRVFAAEIHRIIVTIDDVLCDEFNLSRKGRGRKK